MSCECGKECCGPVSFKPTPFYKIWWTDFKRKLRGTKDSNLVKHAEREMRLAGLYDKDSDYGGMIPEAVMALVKAYAKQGHSGGSHYITMKVFNEVINYRTLKPLTSDPSEWNEVSPTVWQSNRRSDAFSNDGGRTWYYLDEGKDANGNLIMHSEAENGSAK